MLSETIVGAQVESINKRNRIKAVVGMEGTQNALNGIIARLKTIENCTIPTTVQGRQEFLDKMALIKSELVSSGMLIEEYTSVLTSIWDDYDRSASYKMN